MAQSSLQRVVAALKKRYGKPKPPPAGRDPLALILWEMVGYLTDDETRAHAFDLLRDRVGLAPSAVRSARLSVLSAICRAGGPVQPDHRARRMQEVAAIAQDEFDGNVAQVLTWDYSKAVKALQRFPSVAEAGADRILMLCGSHAVLGMESNALRVLCRLGYAEEDVKHYTKMYKAARDAAMAELPKKASVLAEASLLLREHGKETCKTSAPRCGECPVTGACAWYRARAPKATRQL
ncbi:MAG: endonuclease III domain-containing protein [Gemmatimonadaceae bacterium]